MKGEIMETLSYLRGEMGPEDRKRFDAKMASDAALAASVEKIRDTVELVKLWDAPPAKDDLVEIVMARIHATEETQTLRDRLDAVLGRMRNSRWFSPGRMVPVLALASFLAVCLLTVPWNDWPAHKDDFVIKGGVKIIQGARLPKPTVLLEAKEPDPVKIAEHLRKAGLEILGVAAYDTGVVARIGPDPDVAGKTAKLGRLLRHNPDYLDSDGAMVVVVRTYNGLPDR